MFLAGTFYVTYAGVYKRTTRKYNEKRKEATTLQTLFFKFASRLAVTCAPSTRNKSTRGKQIRFESEHRQ